MKTQLIPTTITTVLAAMQLFAAAVPALAGNAPPSAPVTVVNTPANPVPVVQQGTAQISGSVTVNGTPGVNVVNVPTVSLAPSSSVSITGTPSVNVANFPATSGREVVQRSYVRSFEPASQSGFTVELFGPVLAGKRLVIEFIGASVKVSTEQEVSIVQLQESGPGGVFDLSYMELAGTTRTVSQERSYIINQPLRYYVEAGRTLSLAGGWIGSSGFANVSVTVVGYLEDAR